MNSQRYGKINEQRKSEMQARNLRALIKNGAFQFTDTFFPYTSGQIGPYYVQSAGIMNNGQDYQRACDDMASLILEGVTTEHVISGGESRDWIFSFPVSTKLGLDHLMIYKNGKTLGTNDIKGRNVIHVADLNNEGSSPRDLWVPAIKEAGGQIKDIIFYVDRMEDGKEVMKELNLESQAVVSLDAHAWNYLCDNKIVGPEEYNNLRERGSTREERDAWAKKMLRSETGLNTLVKLIQGDDKTAYKAKKVIVEGYPDIRDEIIDRLKKIDTKLFMRLFFDPNGGFM